MAPSRLAFLVLPVVTACVGDIQRSARVPHASVPLSSGQALDAPVELSAGLANVSDPIKPTVGDPNQAVEVPSTEMRSELRLRATDRATVALIYERGFGATSVRPDPTQAPVGPGDVEGYGMSFSNSFTTSTPGFVIGATLELMMWSVPYVEYDTGTSILGPFEIVGHGRANPVSLGVGITPSYRSGRFTVFGGVFARNHPTTQRKEYQTDITFSDNGDVQNGPVNALLHVGVELELDKWLTALLVIHQDLVADSVQYGPGIGLALTARLGG